MYELLCRTLVRRDKWVAPKCSKSMIEKLNIVHQGFKKPQLTRTVGPYTYRSRETTASLAAGGCQGLAILAVGGHCNN